MKKLVLLLVFSLCMFMMPLIAFNQDQKLDSLQNALQAQGEDTNKVKTYFEIIKIVRHYDYDAAIKYAFLQMELSKKINYKWGIGKAYNSIGLIERARGKIGISTNNFLQSAAVFIAATDYNNIVTACVNAADNYAMTGKSDSAIIMAKLGNSYNSMIKDTALKTENKLLFYSNMSAIYYTENKPDSTIVFSDSAITIAKQIDDKARLADEYLQSGVAYQSVKKNNIALEYFSMSLSLYEKFNAVNQMIQVHHAIGLSFYTLKQFDSTINHSLIALRLMNQVKDSTYLEQNYLSMGLAYAGLQKYNEALVWYQKGLSAKIKREDPKIQLQLYQYSAEALYKLADYKNAISYFQKTLAIVDTFDHKTMYECYSMLSSCYEALGDYKNALAYSRKGIAEDHLFFDSAQAQIISEINLKNESQKKEDQIKLLSAKNQLSAALAEKQNQQKKMALTAIGLVIMGGGYGFYRYKKKRQIQSQQAVTNERLRISRELHDEVGSTLSGITMYSHLAKNQMITTQYKEVENSLTIMQESADEMVTRLNDIVWFINPGQDSLNKLSERLEEYARDMAAIKNIQVKVDIPENLDEHSLPVETRRNIYLFCKEAINNAVKYSNGTLLELNIKEIDNKLEFSVSDNGKGFDAATIRRGNGLENMQKRADEIGAKLLFHSKENGGVYVCIHLQL